MSLDPNDILQLLQSVNNNGTVDQKIEALSYCLSILEKESSSSLTLLPGVLSLISEPNLALRGLVIQCLKRIVKTAANFEPTTCIAGMFFLYQKKTNLNCSSDLRL